MSYGYFRPYPQIPAALHRQSPGRRNQNVPGLYVVGTVYSTAGATTATVLAMAEDHYGVSTLDALAEKLDPYGPRTMEDFCQAWWGRPYAECIHEILLLDRYVQLIRQSSRLQKPFNGTAFELNYYGGDILDTTLVSGRRYHTGSDYPLAPMNSVDLGTNRARSETLPARNHITTEFTNSETDVYGTVRIADSIGAGFRTMQANNFVPDQPTYPNTIYWPVAITPNAGGSMLVNLVCWLVETPGGGFIDHEPQDTHILGINVFGTISTVGTFDVGPGGTFFADDVVEDTSFKYVYGREFNPSWGNFTPNYYENLNTDHFFKRIARVPIATEIDQTAHVGTTFTNYEWWTGTTWSTNRANATRLIETNGQPVRSLQGVCKVASGHYLGVAQDPFENKKRVYYSDTPQGPWWHYTNVSCPPYGPDKVAANIGKHGDFCKPYPDFPASTDRVMTTCTALAWATGGASYLKTGKHIVEADAPYPQSVPTKDAAGVDQSSAPPSNVHRMRPLLVR